MNKNKIVMTLADALSLIEKSGLNGTRRRDLVSAINSESCCLESDRQPTASQRRAIRTSGAF
jgi:hypothetical protein